MNGHKTESPLPKYFFLCARLLLGAVFIAASIDKIAHPAEFAKLVQNYQLVPKFLVNIIAIVLPWLEALIGLLILAGLWLPGAVLIANVLLVSFLSAFAYAVARGLDIHCGCFSTKVTGSPKTAWYLARDSLLLLLGAVVMFRVWRKYQGSPAQSAR